MIWYNMEKGIEGDKCMTIEEGCKLEHKGYEIITRYAEESEVVGGRYYIATAKKDGKVVNEYKSCFSFENAIEHLKVLLDFKLSVEPTPQELIDNIYKFYDKIVEQRSRQAMQD